MAGIASTPPASRQISQDNLRRWEKAAREASTTCNQAAAFNRCLYKVQGNMQAELKTIRSELSKGKSAGKMSRATEEMQFLMNFNSSITQSMAKTLEHLTDFVFVMVANTTLIRRDSYLSHLKMGIKPDRWQSLQGKIQALLLLPTCPVRQFMSLIGLLTATEKQVHLGRLHMRPIQWHLKNHWRVPESLEKIIPLPRSLHPHLQWWLEEDNVLQGQPLHPIKHALQIFTDASKEGWGAHLNKLTARGSWSVPESKLHINYLELKAVFLALKEFQDLCVNQIVLVATDNITVITYINKEGGITKWCITNQVDFRSPPVNSVADFLLYLFEVKNLQPSTIDGYRSAIADKLGNTTVNISKDENLTRLLDSFHRDRPKGRRGIPSWNLSLVLHQLTKAPFEPLREASLKHLTFKTVFLLALGSGKRRSEIHAWQHKNIRHQSDCSKVSLIPSPSFLSKNQLAKEGPESVAPVVIPALAPTLDRSLKSDRSLCPVRALRYYLDRTSDLRQHKELVFVSFKKGFDKDTSPATISSWIKQTVILCYELSDQQAHTLHQVKAHDVRAFAASKAFQSGVSLEQILSACHWKSHNTFTQFYLKDVAWADSELYHLGPVVAAQQIHQQSRT